MRTHVHDAAIIGGGPAGSTAGALLGMAGRDVVILEKEAFPRFRIGESLLPYNTRIFDRLGVTGLLEGTFIEKHGVTFVTSSGEIEQTYYFDQAIGSRYPRAFEVQRAAFDRILLDNAQRKGAAVRQRAAVVSARREGGRWILAIGKGGDGPATIEARFLVDASGRDAFLAARGGGREMATGHRKAALFAHMNGVARAGGRDAGNIVIITLRDGWIWLIPFADGTTSVGVVMDGAALRSSGLPAERAFEEAIARCPGARLRTEGARRITPVLAASDWTYTCREIAGEGFLVAGDAAAFLDPIFSSGVLLAMRSGEAAADLINDAVKGGRDDPARLEEYARALLRRIAAYRKMVDLFYSPGFAPLTFHPAARLNLGGAVMSLLAGQVDHGWSVRWRLGLFYAMGRMMGRLGVGPRVELHRVFGREAEPATKGVRPA
jgi:flavin-dependent dehydrogenase